VWFQSPQIRCLNWFLVITSYNRDRYLAKAIESVLAQTYPHFELLIWDDRSTDASLDIACYYAQQDPRICVHAAPHHGIAPAIKAAIAHTTAPYLGWVDSDDGWSIHPNPRQTIGSGNNSQRAIGEMVAFQHQQSPHHSLSGGSTEIF